MTTEKKTQARAAEPPEQMKLRTYRALDAEYDAAMSAATSEGEALADVIRRSLAQYTARIERKRDKQRNARKSHKRGAAA